MQEFTGDKALARYGATVAASSVITLTDNTTELEVGAIGGGGVVMRWVPAGDTAASVVASGGTANWDHFIPPYEVRKFAVPKESQGTSSIVGLNVQNGLYKRVAWVAATGSSSVFAAEY